MAGRIGRFYLALAALSAPWIVYLAIDLPNRNLDRNYRLTWVGFDCAVLFALARTGYLASRRRPRIALTAAATSTLLVVDAWFDITTAGSDSARLKAVVLAAVVELPLAALSAVIARRANQRLTDEAGGRAGRLSRSSEE